MTSKNFVTLDIDITTHLESISILYAHQLPFVVAASLTDTAKLSQKNIQKQMPKKFNLMNPKFLPGGVRIVRAEKKSKDQVAIVYSRDDWMEMQETGGTKRPKKAKEIAIPTKKFSRENRSSSGKMPKSAWASRLGRAKTAQDPRMAGRMGGAGNRSSGPAKPFYMRTKSNHLMLVRRLPNGGRLNIETLYHYKKSAQVRSRWDFEKTVVGTSKANFDKLFMKRLDMAMNPIRK